MHTFFTLRKEDFTGRVLVDMFEKQFDLPTSVIHIGNFFRKNVHSIGNELKDGMSTCILSSYQPKIGG